MSASINWTKTLAQEKKIKLNNLYSAQKLREYVSSNKRHTVRRPIRPSNQLPHVGHFSSANSSGDRLRPTSVGDYFQVYCREVIPQIESRIEERLLQQYISTQINTKEEREEVKWAYLARRENLAKLSQEPELPRPDDSTPPQTQKFEKFMEAVRTTDGDGVSFESFADIGRYTVYPENNFRRMFPKRPFGRLQEDDYTRNKTWGIMTREEGLRLSNDFNRLTLPSERKVDYAAISQMSNSDVKTEVIQNEALFVAIQQDLSIILNELLESKEGAEYEDFKRFLTPPGVFDGFVSVLSQEFIKKPMRLHLCDQQGRDQLMSQFVHKTKSILESNSRDVRSFAEICEVIPMMKLDLNKASLSAGHQDRQVQENIRYKLYLQGYHKFCKHLWRPEDVRRVSFQRFKGFNTGCMLYGERGCGKSQILSYLTTWAHEKQWVNLTISDPQGIVGGHGQIFRHKDGLYHQFDMAKSILEDFRHSNEQILRELPVDMSIYGQFDLSGIHKTKEGPPCPRVYDSEKRLWSDDWKDMLYESEIKDLSARYETMNYTLGDVLPDPKTLIDICDEGIKNSEVATNALAEILEQLRLTDKVHTMITVDDYNTFLRPSGFASFRYANYRKLAGKIPPHDIALARLLMRFDGHLSRNGVKMFATSHYDQYNHMATPKDLHFFDGYAQQVDNLSLNDFRNAMMYYTYTGAIAAEYWKEEELEIKFMETQGNWNAFRHAETTSLRMHF